MPSTSGWLSVDFLVSDTKKGKPIGLPFLFGGDFDHMPKGMASLARGLRSQPSTISWVPPA